jgi:hypothetical protein
MMFKSPTLVLDVNAFDDKRDMNVSWDYSNNSLGIGNQTQFRGTPFLGRRDG